MNLGEPVAPRAMSFSPDGRTLMVMAVDGIDRSTLEGASPGWPRSHSSVARSVPSTQPIASP